MPRTIALVEDDPAIRENYTVALKNQGLMNVTLRNPNKEI